MKKPGSWSVLIVTMALSYALVRWVATKSPYLVAPLTFLVKFIAEQYGEEISIAGKWISSRFKKIINCIRRPTYATC